MARRCAGQERNRMDKTENQTKCPALAGGASSGHSAQPSHDTRSPGKDRPGVQAGRTPAGAPPTHHSGPPARRVPAQRGSRPFCNGGGCATLSCAGTRGAQLSISRRLSLVRRERRRRRWDPGERSAASWLHLLHGSGDRRGQVKPGER